MCKRSYIFLLLLVGLGMGTRAQSVRSFRKISRPEKVWVLTHPFIAQKTFHLTQKVLHTCDSLAKDTVLDGDANGGQLDAFRHAYWMAVLSNHIAPKKAYRLGLAHEKGNRLDFKKNKTEEGSRPDSMACVMDIVNDQVGISMGIKNRISEKPLTDPELIAFVIDKIKGGYMSILLKDGEGRFTTCNGEVIRLADYMGKWGIPKCLANSNRVIPH